MKLSDLAKAIDVVIKEHGDLIVFDDDFYGVHDVYIELAEDHVFDKTWNMPEKFAQIRSYK